MGNTRIPVVNRVCSRCNEVEDEYHVLVQCLRYVNERKGCMPEQLRKRPSMYELIKYLNRFLGLAVRVSASGAVGRGFESRPSHA